MVIGCSRLIDEKTKIRKPVLSVPGCRAKVWQRLSLPARSPFFLAGPGDSGTRAPDPLASRVSAAVSTAPCKGRLWAERPTTGPQPTSGCSSPLLPPSLRHQLPYPLPILPAPPAGSSPVVLDDICFPPSRGPSSTRTTQRAGASLSGHQPSELGMMLVLRTEDGSLEASRKMSACHKGGFSGVGKLGHKIGLLRSQ